MVVAQTELVEMAVAAAAVLAEEDLALRHLRGEQVRKAETAAVVGFKATETLAEAEAEQEEMV
jgi:hypothetical protein